MLYFIITLLLIPILFCCGSKQQNTLSLPIIYTTIDTSKISIDSTIYYKERFARIKHENDSLKTQLFLANYKVEKVRFYLKICLRKPSQDKFLKGWINRAIK